MTKTNSKLSIKGLRLGALAGVSIVLLLAAVAAGADAPAPAPAAKPAPAAAPSGPVPPEAMTGVDFGGLTQEQKDSAVSILNENSCDCGCGMKVGVCRRDDPKCPRSPTLAKQVVDMTKAGKSRAEIVKTVLTPPSKFVQFPVTPGDAPSIGPKDAKVTLIEYFDYQCPFCAKVKPTIDEIVKAYPNDVRVVFKMHALDIHPNALPAAEAAMAAKAQGKFLEMDKKLFENQQKLTRDTFVAIAKEIGLDVDKFTKDLDAHTYLAKIQAEGKEVQDLGATGTPASFVNGRFVSGSKPFAYFKDMIDEEIGWAKANNRPEFKTGKNIAEASARPAQTGPDPNKVYDIAAGNAPFVGPKNAKVTILHYFDYQCPFCVRIHPTLQQVLKDYPKDVRVVYKMHPLPMHPNAMICAQAALSAAAQGKFAEMGDKLYESAATLNRDKIFEIAKNLGMDSDKFQKDFDSPAIKAAIDFDTKEAMGVGATGTPASFVNGHYMSGAQPYDAFKTIIDQEIAKAKQ